MALQISQTYAKIGIHTTPSKLELESKSAVLELRQKHAKVEIQTELPKVKIDQYEAFASAGLKNIFDLSIEWRDMGKKQAMEYIGKVASDGSRLAAIESGGNPIADMAVRDAYPEREFVLDFIPKARPKITVTGEVKIHPSPNSEGIHNGVEANFIPGRLSINYTPANVNIYLAQRNSINIEYRGRNIDTYR